MDRSEDRNNDRYVKGHRDLPEPDLDLPEPDLPEPDLFVDCLGRPCPIPVIELARALQGAPAGSVVEVLSDDPAARLDVPAFCRMRGHTFLGELVRAGGTGLRVRREPTAG